MTRETLHLRRGTDVVTFEHEGRRWTASFGRFADGRLAEIFVDAPRESPIADAARETAIVTSIALQFGAPIETIRHALSGRDAGPIGVALALIEPKDEVQAGAQPQ